MWLWLCVHVVWCGVEIVVEVFFVGWWIGFVCGLVLVWVSQCDGVPSLCFLCLGCVAGVFVFVCGNWGFL